MQKVDGASAKNPDLLNAQPICALATGTGGAIAVVRTSGEHCVDLCNRVFRPLKGGELSEKVARQVVFGHIADEDGSVVDECLATVFRAPHSYTGEDAVEFSLHASPYILRHTLNLLCANGFRMAEPGEFTRRAFLNGKLDLSQAEAVADLIASASKASHDVAINQLRGHFSDELSRLQEDLQRLAALLELELDFDDHETTDFADRRELLELATKADERVSALAESYAKGQALKNGVPVAIVGKTNVGKSTLLNRLLRDERAIVSDIHGTTRDTVEDTVVIRGVSFRFIDTAGLRATDDTVEQIGIERTYNAVARAQVAIWLFDTTPSAEEEAEISNLTAGKSLIKVHNKADLLPTTDQEKKTTHTIYISAKKDADMTLLEDAIYKAAGLENLAESDIIVTSARAHDSLLQAHDSLLRLLEGLAAQIPGDLLAEDLRQAIRHLATITGQTITPESTLHHIFSHFCVGK